MLWSKAIGAGGAGVGGPEGWDVSTAVFNQSFSVAAQDATPFDVSFKPDGLKMYILGFDQNNVHEYNLSSAWNISTAVFLQSFSVAAQDTYPFGLSFKPDGTKMYVIGDLNETVHEYNLSTAWNISTAVFLQSFRVAAQEVSPISITFKPDGTKMYVLGAQGIDVNEYNLGTAWNVTTAVFSQNFSVSAQEIYPRAVFFKPDGLKMYILGPNQDRVYTYDLSSAWNISTAAVNTTQNFSVAAQEIFPLGLFFKPDGTKMYVTGSNSDAVHEYDLG